MMVDLAAAAVTAIVSATVTDGWEGVRAKVARWFGRGDRRETEIAQAQLDESHSVLANLSGDELERARLEQEAAWRARVGDLLARHPEAELELSDLVEQIMAAKPVQRSVRQWAKAKHSTVIQVGRDATIAELPSIQDERGRGARS